MAVQQRSEFLKVLTNKVKVADTEVSQLVVTDFDKLSGDECILKSDIKPKYESDSDESFTRTRLKDIR